MSVRGLYFLLMIFMACSEIEIYTMYQALNFQRKLGLMTRKDKYYLKTMQHLHLAIRCSIPKTDAALVPLEFKEEQLPKENKLPKINAPQELKEEHPHKKENRSPKSNVNIPSEDSKNTVLKKCKNIVTTVYQTIMPKTDSCCSHKNTPSIKDLHTFCYQQLPSVGWHIRYNKYAKLFYKHCKTIINSPNVCDCCCNRLLTAIKNQLQMYKYIDSVFEHTKVIASTILLAYKFDDINLSSFFINKYSKSDLAFLEDVAALFEHKNIITQLRAYKKAQNIALSPQSAQEIIEKNLKEGKRGCDLVANFFETMLHRAKTNDDQKLITELLDSTLKDNTDSQLDLLFIVVKHKYALLERTLKERFGLTLESKNSKKQTLYHRTYLLHHTFDHISGQNPESLVNVIKRLIDENVGGINDRDSDGNTALHYAINLYYTLCLRNSCSAHAHANIKHGVKKIGLKLLLTHPSIDLTIQDKGIPLVWHFFEQSKYLIKYVLASENFNPYQVQYGGTSFLNKFFMEISDGRYDKEKCLDFTRFHNPEAMTKQLQLLAKEYDETLSSFCYDIYEKLEILVSLYLNCGGNITQSDESNLTAIDTAYVMLTGYRKKYNTLLQEGSITDSKKNNPNPYNGRTKLDEAFRSLNTKEIIYHIYLINTPHNKPQWHMVYLLPQFKHLPSELINFIAKLYFDITIKKEIDRTVALQVKKNFDNIKCEKENYYHPSTPGPQKIDAEYYAEKNRIERLDLDYYRKTQGEKEQYRKEVLQKTLGYKTR